MIETTCKKEIANMKKEIIATLQSSILQMSSTMAQPSSQFAGNPPRVHTSQPPSNPLPQDNSSLNTNYASYPTPTNYSSNVASTTANVPKPYHYSPSKYGSSSN